MASTLVRMTEERAQQLRDLADAQGTTISGAVASLMRLAYEHTETKRNIPGVRVNALSDGLAIRLPDSDLTGFSFEAAARLAEVIREYLRGDHAGEKNVELTDTDSHVGSFAIWRKGNAIKIAIPSSAPEKNFTRDLAEEFADLLESAVAKAHVS